MSLKTPRSEPVRQFRSVAIASSVDRAPLVRRPLAPRSPAPPQQPIPTVAAPSQEPAQLPPPTHSVPSVIGEPLPAVVVPVLEVNPLPKPVAPPVVTGTFASVAVLQTSRNKEMPITRDAGFGTQPGPVYSRAAGTVRLGGFGASSAPVSGVVAQPRAITAAGFDSIAPGDHRSKGTPLPQSAAVRKAVQILRKPKPEYTDEARRLKLEGEVWLRVVFSADGSLKILRVERSLGHGLDESATLAVSQIRFQPAEEDGQAVDEAATIRVQFQLAN